MAAETSTSAEANIKRWPKHAVWLGLVINLVGFVSYYLYFVQFPDLRDFPIVNLPLVLAGVLLTGVGSLMMFKQGSSVWGKGLASLALLMALVVTGFFNFYIFALSYQLPEASGFPQAKTVAPDFTLTDQNGEQVTLSDYRGKKVVVVFYRGNW